jgi:hypothetical protein
MRKRMWTKLHCLRQERKQKGKETTKGKRNSKSERGRPRKRGEEVKHKVRDIINDLNSTQSRSTKAKSTCRNIADILKDQYHVEVSFTTVHRIMKEIEEEDMNLEHTKPISSLVV